jgi:hypothetical protein
LDFDMTDIPTLYADIMAAQRRLSPNEPPDVVAVLHLVSARSGKPLSQVRRALNMDIEEMKR